MLLIFSKTFSAFSFIIITKKTLKAPAAKAVALVDILKGTDLDYTHLVHEIDTRFALFALNNSKQDERL